MLLQFSMRNHRSMKEKAVISMSATKDKSLAESLITPDGKRVLVPVMAIYGANAAGKSNVLHALFLMRDMICGKYAKLLKGEPLLNRQNLKLCIIIKASSMLTDIVLTKRES